MVQSKTRNVSIDLIKVVAIIGVIAIHVGSSVLHQNAVGSPRWMYGLFWGVFFRASVPLFLMASGAVMLDSHKQLSLKKLFFHNILRIVVAMIVWGFAYKLYNLYQLSALTPEMIWYSFKRVLLFDQEFHFYYIHIILPVYIFLPITRLFVEKADKNHIVYFLIVWLFLAIIFPTAQNFAPFNLVGGMINQWAINMTYASIGYGILGFYLKKYSMPLYVTIPMAAIGFAITFGMCYHLSAVNGVLNDLFLSGMSLGVCFMATGIFSAFMHVRISDFWSKIIIYVSKGSFCIYLSHMFFIYELDKLAVNAGAMPAIVSIPLISVFVLILSIVLYVLISKIPVLKKWII